MKYRSISLVIHYHSVPQSRGYPHGMSVYEYYMISIIAGNRGVET
ncbi:hypothetical protein E2C01_071901 [Portunus trituberculatus]|uniref:Uncharacterized protein n=1 Tax=Portunus trituberculatus TaxID=210409 RepID=A0A5B7I983_PORTR|nr:hypothetical protein [Portunus trituberculatus]